MAGDVVDAMVVGQSQQMAPLPVFSGAQMTQALQAYKGLQDALDKAMPDQIMDLDGKKFRKKGYWRAVAVAFNITVETIEERRESAGAFHDGRENFGYVVSKRATAPSGRSVTSDGTCFAVEKARRFKCIHPESPGSRRTLHFPHSSCPNFDPEFQWRTLPGDATEHNVRGHASTRAFNRAVSDLVGFGEVSAEEMIRDEHEDKAATTTGTTATATKPAAATGLVKVTAATDAVEKTETSKAKPGRVTLSDGRSGTTFDKTLLATAKEAHAKELTVEAKFEEKKVGANTYLNLVGLEIVRQAEPALPLEDKEPVGSPETLKATMRSVKESGGGEYWTASTNCRTYVTRDADVRMIWDNFFKAGEAVLIGFKPLTTAKGLFNVIETVVQAAGAKSAEPVAAGAF